MLDIKPLTTLLVKLENGVEKIAHFDIETKKVYCTDLLSDEEIFQIRNRFEEYFNPQKLEDPIEKVEFSHFEDILNYYINQGEVYDYGEQQHQSESDPNE